MKKQTREQIERYIDVFMERLPGMLEHHEGKFTVIGRDEKPIGFWDTAETAYENGVKQYQTEPFLVRPVKRDYLDSGRYGKPLFMGFPSIQTSNGVLASI